MPAYNPFEKLRRPESLYVSRGMRAGMLPGQAFARAGENIYSTIPAMSGRIERAGYVPTGESPYMFGRRPATWDFRREPMAQAAPPAGQAPAAMTPEETEEARLQRGIETAYGPESKITPEQQAMWEWQRAKTMAPGSVAQKARAAGPSPVEQARQTRAEEERLAREERMLRLRYVEPQEARGRAAVTVAERNAQSRERATQLKGEADILKTELQAQSKEQIAKEGNETRMKMAGSLLLAKMEELRGQGKMIGTPEYNARVEDEMRKTIQEGTIKSQGELNKTYMTSVKDLFKESLDAAADPMADAEQIRADTDKKIDAITQIFSNLMKEIAPGEKAAEPEAEPMAKQEGGATRVTPVSVEGETKERTQADIDGDGRLSPEERDYDTLDLELKKETSPSRQTKIKEAMKMLKDRILKGKTI